MQTNFFQEHHSPTGARCLSLFIWHHNSMLQEMDSQAFPDWYWAIIKLANRMILLLLTAKTSYGNSNQRWHGSLSAERIPKHSNFHHCLPYDFHIYIFLALTGTKLTSPKAPRSTPKRRLKKQGPMGLKDIHKQEIFATGTKQNDRIQPQLGLIQQLPHTSFKLHLKPFLVFWFCTR